MRQYVTSQGTTALLKDASVDMEGTHKPSVDPIIGAAGPIYNRLGYDLIVTSAADGTHSEGSLHYTETGRFDGGQALDLRCAQWHGYPKEDRLEIEQRLEERLPNEYDVVGESGGHNSHIHIERDL